MPCLHRNLREGITKEAHRNKIQSKKVNHVRSYKQNQAVRKIWSTNCGLIFSKKGWLLNHRKTSPCSSRTASTYNVSKIIFLIFQLLNFSIIRSYYLILLLKLIVNGYSVEFEFLNAFAFTKYNLAIKIKSFYSKWGLWLQLEFLEYCENSNLKQLRYFPE